MRLDMGSNMGCFLLSKVFAGLEIDLVTEAQWTLLIEPDLYEGVYIQYKPESQTKLRGSLGQCWRTRIAPEISAHWVEEYPPERKCFHLFPSFQVIGVSLFFLNHQ